MHGYACVYGGVRDDVGVCGYACGGGVVASAVVCVVMCRCEGVILFLWHLHKYG